MSWSFKPGDRVVCVDADGTNLLALRQVYVIRGIIPEQPAIWRGQIRLSIGILLQGIANPPDKGGFAPERFRPVRTTSIESLRAHLNTIPANRSVDA